MPEFTVDSLRAQLEQLGVRRGGTLLVHSSFKALRPVEGGPLGVICVFCGAIGREGTLVMPTMTDGASRFDPRVTPSVGWA